MQRYKPVEGLENGLKFKKTKTRSIKKLNLLLKTFKAF